MMSISYSVVTLVMLMTQPLRPDWTYTQPYKECLRHNCEKKTKFSLLPPPGQIFVGKIPRDLFEDELVPLFEKAGPIWDLRLMMDPLSGLNRGYAFVTFCTKDAAQEAVKLVRHLEGGLTCGMTPDGMFGSMTTKKKALTSCVSSLHSDDSRMLSLLPVADSSC